jgi:glycosyltransferase involved in cell wall biosynthesis
MILERFHLPPSLRVAAKNAAARARRFAAAPLRDKTAVMQWHVDRILVARRKRLPGPVNRFRARYGLALAMARRRAGDVYDQREPLVSILIPTYNRAGLLAERSVPSALRQTYERVEVIIVGDACTDDTPEVVAKIDDPRIRFVNLPSKEVLPADPWNAWMVAGTQPANFALALARGRWVAWLDDDDEFSDDHIEALLRACFARRLEFAYGIMSDEVAAGQWQPVGAFPPVRGHICNDAVLYASYLSFLRYDAGAWRYKEPGDWNLWKRMWGAGVRMGFVNQTVGRHFKHHHPAS